MKHKIKIEATYICPKCHSRRTHAIPLSHDFADKFEIIAHITCTNCKTKIVKVGFFAEPEVAGGSDSGGEDRSRFKSGWV